MLRKIIAIFFLSIFISHAVLPAIISLVDDDVDIAFLMDTNEEESKEGETSKEKEIKIIEVNNLSNSLADESSTENNTIYLKRYTTVYLNLLSPPPELT